MKLKDKVAIITGAGAGIGEATAILFAKEGAKICCNSISKSALSVSEQIKNFGGEAIFVQADVSIEEEAKRIVEKTIENFEKIDILFNNAGIVLGGSIDTISTGDWDRTMAVNVRGIYLVSKYTIPYLKKAKGTIINNSSILAFKGVKDRAAYTASKGAVLSLTRAMAADYVEDKVRINAICPGVLSLTRAMAADYVEDKVRINAICPGTTDTPSLTERIKNRGGDYEQVRQRYIARQKMGRLGTPQEIAEGVLFLILNEFCTGISLSIDGGMSF